VEITGEKEKADSILRCMIEGVVVLDPKGQRAGHQRPSKRDVSMCRPDAMSTAPDLGTRAIPTSGRSE
jgi:hypothetical protein